MRCPTKVTRPSAGARIFVPRGAEMSTPSCGRNRLRIGSQRDDENFCYAAAWEFKGVGKEPELHKDVLTFEEVHLTQRSYK